MEKNLVKAAQAGWQIFYLIEAELPALDCIERSRDKQEVARTRSEQVVFKSRKHLAAGPRLVAQDRLGEADTG